MAGFQLYYNFIQTCAQSGLLLGPHLASWAVADNEPLTRSVFEVSSVASEHVVKPDNFSSRPDYRAIDNH
jgi:hypothetical protein